jgi:hypothetical protein
MKTYKINQENDFFAITADVFRLWRPCLDALKLNLSVFLMLILVPMVILMLMLGLVAIPVVSSGHFDVINIVSISVLGLLLLISMVFLWPAIIIAQLDSVKGKKVEFADLIKRAAKIALPFIGLSALIGLITLVGFVLIIIPGLLAMFFLTLAVYIYVDKKPKIIDAIKQSYQITKANWRLVFAMFVVNFLLSFLGWIPVIGTVINIVLSVIYFCLPALIYLQIKK